MVDRDAAFRLLLGVAKVSESWLEQMSQIELLNIWSKLASVENIGLEGLLVDSVRIFFN
jgi:hypothetical protein